MQGHNWRAIVYIRIEMLRFKSQESVITSHCRLGYLASANALTPLVHQASSRLYNIKYVRYVNNRRLTSTKQHTTKRENSTLSHTYIHTCTQKMVSLVAKNSIRCLHPKPCLPKPRHFSNTCHVQIMSTSNLTQTQLDIRTAIQSLCTSFPNSYWRTHDASAKDPTSFHAALATNGWLGIALPERFGGSGLGISEATMMMQTISESGAGMAGAQAVHGNVYATQPLVRHASAEMCSELVPRIVSGEVRVCFGVTEPGSGLDTLGLKTVAVREGDEYVISGEKVWITAAQVAGYMILLARTSSSLPSSSSSSSSPAVAVSSSGEDGGDDDDDAKIASKAQRSKSHGLSLFCIPLNRQTPGLEIRKIRKMGGRAVDANQVFFDNYRVPASSLIGAENNGFRIILQGMNAERCLLAGEALGLGYCALSRAADYARSRTVFNRPIGMNQGIAHPLADAYMALEAAKLATYHAASLYDQSQQEGSAVTQDVVGVAANSAKYLAAEAAFRACERAVLTHGGMGYADEYDVERWFRESLVPRIAPVSREMILNYVGEKVLGLPRSY